MPVYLDGVNLEDLGVRVSYDYQHPAAPDTRDYTMEIPGKHGAWDFGADLGPRRIELPCFIVQNTPADVQRTIRALMAHLYDSYGRPKTMRLVFSTEPDKYYLTRISGGLPVERIYRVGRFVLPFVAFDPFAYSSLDAYDIIYKYDMGMVYGSGLIYPNARTIQDLAFVYPAQMVQVGGLRKWAGFVWTYSRHMSSQYNHSDYKSPLIVEISGNVTNPRITHNNTGQQISIAATIANQTLLIDSEKMTVTINGANVIHMMSGDFIDLQPGDNGFFFEGINPFATVTYKWEHKFL